MNAVDPQSEERALREQLAKAPDPTQPAIKLAQLLTSREHYRDALSVLDTACERVRSAPLRAARASVLRDLGQRHNAVVELESMVQDLPVHEITLDDRFELAELLYLEGRPAEAKAALAKLQQHAKDTEWSTLHTAQVQELDTALQRGQAPTVVLVRDLLGNLRGAPPIPARRAALEYLLAGKNLDAELARSLHVRALWIAIDDESPAIRARAVQLGTPDEERRVAFYERMLVDPAPLVRRVTAPRAAQALRESALPLLARRLAQETDAHAFQALHDALASVRTAPIPCSHERAAESDYRARVVAAWQQALGSTP